jgi:hypothetical protein
MDKQSNQKEKVNLTVVHPDIEERKENLLMQVNILQ